MALADELREEYEARKGVADPPAMDFKITTPLKPGLKIWWRWRGKPGSPVSTTYIVEVRPSMICIADSPHRHSRYGTWLMLSEIAILDTEEARNGQ